LEWVEVEVGMDHVSICAFEEGQEEERRSFII
jgi:hypothetical protein